MCEDESKQQQLGNPDRESDEELVQKTLCGDLNAFDELVIRYQNYVAATLFSFCPHRSDLEDLVQETMIKAYHALAKWEPRASFGSWLRRIAINTGNDYYRRCKRSPIFQLSSLGESSQEAALDDASQPDPSENSLDLVQLILSKLTPEDRTLMTLQYLQDVPLQEIADALGWSLSKTKVRSLRARQKLKAVLKRHEIQE